jgi:hypothetical protein
MVKNGESFICPISGNTLFLSKCYDYNAAQGFVECECEQGNEGCMPDPEFIQVYHFGDFILLSAETMPAALEIASGLYPSWDDELGQELFKFFCPWAEIQEREEES